MNSPTSLVANTAEEKHTPTPWFQGLTDEDMNVVYRSDGEDIYIVADTTISNGAGHEIENANAAFIVTACNSFDALTEANARMREALEKAQHRLDALRAYVPAHMLAAYLLDKDEITDAALKVTP